MALWFDLHHEFAYCAVCLFYLDVSVWEVTMLFAIDRANVGNGNLFTTPANDVSTSVAPLEQLQFIRTAIRAYLVYALVFVDWVILPLEKFT